jgi:hypothetical protein
LVGPGSPDSYLQNFPSIAPPRKWNPHCSATYFRYPNETRASGKGFPAADWFLKPAIPKLKSRLIRSGCRFCAGKMLGKSSPHNPRSTVPCCAGEPPVSPCPTPAGAAGNGWLAEAVDRGGGRKRTEASRPMQVRRGSFLGPSIEFHHHELRCPCQRPSREAQGSRPIKTSTPFHFWAWESPQDL